MNLAEGYYLGVPSTGSRAVGQAELTGPGRNESSNVAGGASLLDRSSHDRNLTFAEGDWLWVKPP